MSVIIRLQSLAWTASSRDIRHFFKGLTIPDGGVHIVGGDRGDAFIAFASDEDARQAMTMEEKEIHNKPVQLFLSSKVEMSRVIADARDRLASTSPTPPPLPMAAAAADDGDGDDDDADDDDDDDSHLMERMDPIKTYEKLIPPPPPPEYPSKYPPEYPSEYSPDYPAEYPPEYPAEYTPEYSADYPAEYPLNLPSDPPEDSYVVESNFRLSENRKRSPSYEPEDASKAVKRPVYSTAAWAAKSSEFAAAAAAVAAAVVEPKAGPSPSNDTFIMAKAEEALKALQMMGVIPSFYGQDSTEVTASLSKDSRMSTIVDEDPQDSANRLVPKSIATAAFYANNGMDGNGSISTTTTANTTSTNTTTTTNFNSAMDSQHSQPTNECDFVDNSSRNWHEDGHAKPQQAREDPHVDAFFSSWPGQQERNPANSTPPDSHAAWKNSQSDWPQSDSQPYAAECPYKPEWNVKQQQPPDWNVKQQQPQQQPQQPQQRQPDWSHPPLKKDEWDDVPNDDDDDDKNEVDLPYGMHHVPGGVRAPLPANAEAPFKYNVEKRRVDHHPHYDNDRGVGRNSGPNVEGCGGLGVLRGSNYGGGIDGDSRGGNVGVGNVGDGNVGGDNVGGDNVGGGFGGTQGRIYGGNDQSGSQCGGFGKVGSGGGGSGVGFDDELNMGGGGPGPEMYESKKSYQHYVNRDVRSGAGSIGVAISIPDTIGVAEKLGIFGGGIASGIGAGRYSSDNLKRPMESSLKSPPKLMTSGGGGGGGEVNRSRATSGTELPTRKSSYYSDSVLPPSLLPPLQKANPFDVLFEKPFQPSTSLPSQSNSFSKSSSSSSSSAQQQLQRKSTPILSPTSQSAVDPPPPPPPAMAIGPKVEIRDVGGCFVALINMDWNVDFQRVVEFLRPASEGPLGVYPCYGVIGKYNGNFVAQLRSEEDMGVVLKKDGQIWGNRKIVVFRILERQFIEVERAFASKLPYLRIERPPPHAFEVRIVKERIDSKEGTPRAKIEDRVLPKEEPSKMSPTPPNPSEGTTANDVASMDKDLRSAEQPSLESTSGPTEPMYEHRRDELKSTPTVFEYNNGETESADEFKSVAVDDDHRYRRNSGNQGKLFESRNRDSASTSGCFLDEETFGGGGARVGSSGFFPDSTFTGDVDSRTTKLTTRTATIDPPIFSCAAGIMGSPPVHRNPIFRWIGVVKSPPPDVSRKEVRRCLGEIQTIDEEIHILHPRKQFPDELVFLEFVDRETLYEGLEQLRESSRIVQSGTRIFRVTQQQYLDCVAAHERGLRFVVEPPVAPVLQHFFLYLRNAPPETTTVDLTAFIHPTVAVEIHRLESTPGSANFVVEVMGKSNLASILALDKKSMMGKIAKFDLDVCRIVRYQHEDALTSIEKRFYLQLNPPLKCELDADDKWYAEYLEGFDRELRTFAFDFKRKRKNFDSNNDNDGDTSGENSRRMKSPSRERRGENRDRSLSKGRDVRRSGSPRNASPRSREDGGSGRGGRRDKREEDRRRVDRFGRVRDSKERDRKTDDDKFAERKKGGVDDDDDDVVIVEDPKKPVKPNADGKYAVMIGGLDSRVAQSRMNAFFSEMGFKISKVRIVFRPGSSTAIAFAETTDYFVYSKAFEFEGRLLDRKFPVCIENVPIDRVNKKFDDIRKGRWFPTMTTSSTSPQPPRNGTQLRQRACVPGIVRPLMVGKDGLPMETKKPVAVVNPENRVTVPAPVANTSSSVPPLMRAGSSTFLTSTSSIATSTSSSNQFDATSFPAGNPRVIDATTKVSTVYPLSTTAAPSTTVEEPMEADLTSILIESAPADVTSADVEEFFKGRELSCNGIDIRRDDASDEETAGSGGKTVVIVSFKRPEECEEALKISKKLKGAEVCLRRPITKPTGNLTANTL